MQKIVELPSGRICLVETSLIAFNHRLAKSDRLRGKMFASCPVTSGFSWDLPPGSWQLLGKGTEITEVQARGIVDWYGSGDGAVDEAGVGDTFWCYDETEFCFDTAIESLVSLIRSEGFKPEATVVLFEPKK